MNPFETRPPNFGEQHHCAVSPSFLVDLQATSLKLLAEVRAPSRATRSTPDWLQILPSLDADLARATAASRKSAKSLLDHHEREIPRSPLLNSVSLFRAMGFCREETSHTRTLAWLLDAGQSHGFGSELLDAFLGAVNCKDSETRESIRASILHSRQTISEVSAERRLSRGSRVDVYAEGSFNDGARWALLIEAKIDAAERADQLIDYEQAAKRPNTLGVFLSPEGRRGTSCEQSASWGTLSFLDLARAFMQALPSLRDKPGASFLTLYLTGVLEDVCGIRCDPSTDKILTWNSPYEIQKLLGEK